MRSVRVLAALSFLVFSLGGCAQRAATLRGAERRLALLEAEALFRQRADPNAFDEALRLYLSLTERGGGDPEVLGRLARAFTLRGYRVGGSAGHIDLRTGRDYALQCLLATGEFASIVEAAGGVMTPEAAAVLTDETFCLAWSTLPWARLLHEQGPAGSAIDLETLEAMGRRLGQLGGPEFGAGRAFHVQGLTAALRPRAFGGDFSEAEALLRKAMVLSPARLTPSVDLAEYVLLPDGRASEASVLLQTVSDARPSPDSPDRPENDRAQQRARVLLGSGRLPGKPRVSGR